MTDQTMPQPSMELRRIHWAACFPFTTLFRTFRIAMQPSKLALALAAVLLTCLWGRALDGLWLSRCQPPAGEVNAFWQQADIGAWRDNAKANLPSEIREIYGLIGEKPPEKLNERLVSDPDEAFDMLTKTIRKVHAAKIASAREQTKDASEDEVNATIARQTKGCLAAYQKAESIRPCGVYTSFLQFEQRVGRQIANAAIHLNFSDGLSDVLTSRIAPPPDAAISATFGQPPRARSSTTILAETLARQMTASAAATSGTDEFKGMGVLPCAVLALRGLQWMVWEHFWFAVLFGLPALVIWGLFGGAICRMAALNVARDERLEPGTAMAFAKRKLLSLASAPLFPMGFVLLIGAVLFVGGLFMAIPAVGEIVGGLGMILGLAAGLLMAVMLIGGLVGAPLMWPTIAVEGSDAFDAFSRSYSYVFNKPWRAAFYAAVLTVYGAICYLLVRFVMLVGLKAARFFIGAGLAGTNRPASGGAGATKIDVLWPAPTWDHLLPDRLPLGTQAWDSGGAFLIGLWLTVVIAMLCAFAASFFLSGSTIIYYLLRREVDATDIEEVYLDSDEEEQPLELPSAAGEPGAASIPPKEISDQTGTTGEASAGAEDGNIDAE